MTAPDPAKLTSIAAGATGLRLLVLHGSRARGDHRTDSDWDFGYLAHSAFDPDSFIAILSASLGDAIDLADLSRASALLRFKAAADGMLLYESEPGTWDGFRLEAVAAWCDMEPVLTRAYDAELSRLAR